MLQPEDLGKAVVDVLKNNSNYYTYDIMLRNTVISHILGQTELFANQEN